jgi:hypothetical protein
MMTLNSSSSSATCNGNGVQPPMRPTSSNGVISRTPTPDQIGNSNQPYKVVESRTYSASPPLPGQTQTHRNLNGGGNVQVRQWSPVGGQRIRGVERVGGNIRVLQMPPNSISPSRQVLESSNDNFRSNPSNHRQFQPISTHPSRLPHPHPNSHPSPTQPSHPSSHRRPSTNTTERYCPYLIPLRSRNMDGTVRKDENGTGVEVVWIDVREARSAMRQLQEASEMTIEPLPLPPHMLGMNRGQPQVS